MNVWIVDDDSSIRWVLEKALTNAHFNCITFSSGQEAIDALVTNPQKPAVLISDIKMPGLDGFTLLHHVKEQYPDLPVIIMTAHSDLDAAVNAYQRGSDRKSVV